MAREKKRTARTTQRHRALDVLFEADEKGMHSGESILELLSQRQEISPSQHPIGEFGSAVVSNYAQHISDIDTLIEAASEDWALERMNSVDRSALRGALAELKYMDTPRSAVIPQWGGLVKLLSTDRSVPFVMGVLNRAADILEREQEESSQSISTAVENADMEDDSGILDALKTGLQ